MKSRKTWSSIPPPRLPGGTAGGEDTERTDGLGRIADVVHAQEQRDLGLVGEDDVDLVAEEATECIAVALDAERVREAQRDQPAGLASPGHDPAERPVRVGDVP